MREWITGWIETWRIARPFSKARRDLLASLRDIENEEAWVEVERPTSDPQGAEPE